MHGNFTVRPALATDEPGQAGPQEYVLVAVKHFQLAGALASLRPLVGPSTTLVPLLNGVDAHDVLIEAFSPGQVVGGLCSIVSSIAAMRAFMIGSPSMLPERSITSVTSFAATAALPRSGAASESANQPSFLPFACT